MNLSLTAALFILLFVGSSHAAPLTSSSPWQGPEHGSLSVASNKISYINEPETVQPDDTTSLVDPTMSTPSLSTFNITTPNDNTTTGITARAPPLTSSRRAIITLVGRGPSSCAEKTSYINSALQGMSLHLGQARTVLSARDAHKSIGARAFFGKRTLLTYMHRLNVEFRRALSSVTPEQLEEIRASRYKWPHEFFNTAQKAQVEDYNDLQRSPPGRYILISCLSRDSPPYLWEPCRTNTAVAVSNMNIVPRGHAGFSDILLCPSFFGGMLTHQTLPQVRASFKRAFKGIADGVPRHQLYNFGSNDGGA